MKRTTTCSELYIWTWGKRNFKIIRSLQRELSFWWRGKPRLGWSCWLKSLIGWNRNLKAALPILTSRRSMLPMLRRIALEPIILVSLRIVKQARSPTINRLNQMKSKVLWSVEMKRTTSSRFSSSIVHMAISFLKNTTKVWKTSWNHPKSRSSTTLNITIWSCVKDWRI